MASSPLLKMQVIPLQVLSPMTSSSFGTMHDNTTKKDLSFMQMHTN